MTIGAVILAAGAGHRFGGMKQLALFEGETLVRRAARVAVEASCCPVVVVTGSQSAAVASALTGLSVEIAGNPGWARGIGTSIQCGVDQALRYAPHLEAMILMTCDQPLVTPETIRSLAGAIARRDGSIAASAYADALGVPALFLAKWFPKLRTLPAAVGAKYLLEAYRKEVVPVGFANGVYDVDFPADLRRLVQGATTSTILSAD